MEKGEAPEDDSEPEASSRGTETSSVSSLTRTKPSCKRPKRRHS